jgi:hypothetical protein
MGVASAAVRVDGVTHERLTAFCNLTGKTLQSVVERALANYFNDEAPVWEQAAKDTLRRARN